jgi:hypothetical protein
MGCPQSWTLPAPQGVAQNRFMTWLQRWLISLVLLLPLSALGQAATDAERLIVEDLSCRGNAVTSCDFILGHVYLAPGDAVDEEELGKARLRLGSLPSFHSVEIYLEKGSARGRVRVVIEVTEADPYAREWLTGSSYRFGSLSHLFAGRLTNQKLFGAGKLLDATLLAYVPLDGRVQRVLRTSSPTENTRLDCAAMPRQCPRKWTGVSGKRALGRRECGPGAQRSCVHPRTPPVR